MAYRFQFRGDTEANWKGVILADREIGIIVKNNKNTNLYKIGDGLSKFEDLPLFGFNGNLSDNLHIEDGEQTQQSVLTKHVLVEKFNSLDEALTKLASVDALMGLSKKIDDINNVLNNYDFSEDISTLQSDVVNLNKMNDLHTKEIGEIKENTAKLSNKHIIWSKKEYEANKDLMKEGVFYYIYDDEEEILYTDVSIDNILEAIKTDKYIKINSQIKLVDKPLIIEKETIIDLNDQSIIGGVFTESDNLILEGNNDSFAFWVKSGSTLTLNGNGEIRSQNAKYSMAVWADGGDVIINGGVYYNGGDSCDLIYASNGGHVTINGGTFIATVKGDEPGTGNLHSALNIKNADYQSGISNIVVKGGRFYKFDPSNNLSEGPNTNFVAPGYKVVVDGDYYEVIKEE